MSDIERNTQNAGTATGASLVYGLSTLGPGLQFLTIILAIFIVFTTKNTNLNHFESFGLVAIALMLAKAAPRLLICIFVLIGILWASNSWNWSSWVVIPIIFLVIFTFTRLLIQGAKVDNDPREYLRAYDIGETAHGVFAFSLIAFLVAEYFDYSILGLTMNWQQWVLFLLTSGCTVYLAEEKSKKVMNSAGHNFLSFLLTLSFMYWLYLVSPTLLRYF